jgi:hypothetical protein
MTGNSNDGGMTPLDVKLAALRVPTRTLPLLAILLGAGAIVLTFTLLTVQGLDPNDLATHPVAVRTRFSVTYWLDHGYFRSYGLLVRPSIPGPGFHYYKSSTGGHLVTGFLAEKIYRGITGKFSWRLLAVHNQIWTLMVAVAIGLLGFRLAQQLGSRPLHALMMALCIEVVHFTFPDNLALYLEMNGRPYFLFFAVVFLLLEERSTKGRTRALMIAQAVAGFFLVYMEYIAGAAFIVSFVILTLLLGRGRAPLKRLVLTAFLPMILAFGVFGMQRALARAGGVPTSGSEFLFRTGLDGSSQYYGDHLDIAYGRDLVRLNFAHNRPYLFRWKWLFFAGVTALLTVLFLAMKGRVATLAVISLLSLLGSYLLQAALFSQAVMIHPYLFDLLLFTPLVLALFVVAPALIESMTEQRGIALAVVFFAAAWVTMVQMRRYAMQYPRPPDRPTIGYNASPGPIDVPAFSRENATSTRRTS